MTRVSVGLPVYNGEKYLDHALRTLVSQTHEDLEIIISDNASTDGTRRICEEYAARDPRIRYYCQPVNRGGSYNHNFVARQATAPYFRWYSADDWMAPDCIEQCVTVLDSEPDVVLAWATPTPVYDGDPYDKYRRSHHGTTAHLPPDCRASWGPTLRKVSSAGATQYTE